MECRIQIRSRGLAAAGLCLLPLMSRHSDKNKTTAAKHTDGSTNNITQLECTQAQRGSGGPEAEPCVRFRNLIGIKALLVEAPAAMATGG